MEIITADWETYYDKEYSLRKLTTEAYVRDPRFEAIMLGLRWPDDTKELITGTHEEIRYRLDAVDWSKYAVLCHNTIFDAAIFSWHFGVRPRAWLDTLSMARAMFGSRNNSLAMLAKRYGIGEKGNEIVNAEGMRRQDFTPDQFKRYAQYCLNDVQLCYDMWHLMSEGWYNVEEFDKRELYPLEELKLIDQHIRMFSEPVLRLNADKIRTYHAEVVARKEELLSKTEFSKESLASNPQFAEVLRSLGVEPPLKVSKTTGKTTFAFAKTDPDLKALLDHPDVRVQTAVAARLGTKSTLEETRALTFIGIAERNPLLPVPLKYSYARTKRSSGGDGINLQNLPARNGTELKSCIEAPPGYVLIDCDSSNIEARVLAWLAEQNDLVADFANKVDVYCKMATRIYGRTVTKADKQERFVGKTVTLGAGYQTGGAKLQATLKTATPPMDMDLDECQRIIDIYRMTYPRIKQLWRTGENCIEAMHADKTMWFGKKGVALAEGRKGIRLPSGLYISYPQMHRVNKPGRGAGWAYKDDTGIVDIYGGKLTENCLAAGTLVLTDRGWVAIEEVRPSDLVHDGEEFVVHGGTVCKAVQACVAIDGVFMTPDHEVLTNDGWIPASQNPEPYRPNIWHANSVESGAQQRTKKKLAVSVRMWRAVRKGWNRGKERSETRRHPELRMCDKTTNVGSKNNARDVKASSIRGMAQYDRPLPATFSQSVEGLWWKGYTGLRTVTNFLRELLVGHGSDVRARPRVGSLGQRWELQPRELPVDESPRKYYEQKDFDTGRGCTEVKRRDRYIAEHDLLPTSTRLDSGSIACQTGPWKQVYDIINAGPRQRFVVKGDSGPFIVHNCVQALARIIVMSQLVRISRKLRVALTVHDSIIALAREDERDEARAYVESCMRWVPQWATGLPINCESKWGYNYGEMKDE